LQYATGVIENSNLDTFVKITVRRIATDNPLPSTSTQTHERFVEKWKDNQMKSLSNTGQEYLTRREKLKTLRPVCTYTCTLRCYKKFDTKSRQGILKHFWNLADHTKQWEYINKFSERRIKTKVRADDFSRRKYTKKYFLPLPSNSSDESSYEPVQVCLKTFLNTLCITDQVVRTAHDRLGQEGATLPGNRGKNINHLIIIRTPEMVNSVCDHVASLRSDPSHNDLSMKEMFSLYTKWDQLKNYRDKALTLSQYSDIAKINMSSK
jgi:hypothetical protein